MDEDAKAKKVDKILKNQKKMVELSVMTETRVKAKERHDEIAEKRKQHELRAYIESKKDNANFLAKQQEAGDKI